MRRRREQAPLAQIFEEEINAVKDGLESTRLPFKVALRNLRLVLLEGFVRSEEITLPWRQTLNAITSSAELLVFIDCLIEEELPQLIQEDRFR